MAVFRGSEGVRTLVVTIDDFPTAEVDGSYLVVVDDARALLLKTDHAAHPLDAVIRVHDPNHHQEA